MKKAASVINDVMDTSESNSSHGYGAVPALSVDSSTHPKYRADIDGLRALAVIAVVIFHAFPRWLPGGYVGVDVFFVISGFLISSILFSSFGKGTFSFADFYARRARRIFPALIVMIVSVAAFGWYVLTPDEFSMLGKHIAAGAGFVSNVNLWLEAGYFDTTSDAKPLLHLWSLGVEEQFYIVWPMVLWLGYRSRANFLMLAALVGIFSFLLNVGTIAQHADAVFYLPYARFWELLSGAGLAYAVTIRRCKDVGSLVKSGSMRTLVVNGCSLAGLLLLLGAIIVLDKSRAYPGWWAVVPVMGVVLVIAAGPQALINRFILGNRAVAGVGLISYPLYLWHWPLLAFGHIFYGQMSKEVRVVMIVTAFVLAWLTYRFIEQKLRHTGMPAAQQRGRTNLAALYCAMALCGGTGLAIFTQMLPARGTTRDVDALLAAQYDWDFPPRNFAKLAATGPNFYRRSGSNPNYTVFIGDSLVEQYGARVEQLLSDKTVPHYSVIFATGPACPAIPGVTYIAEHTHPACAGVTRTAFEIARRPDVKKVVIGGDWSNTLSEDNRELMIRSGTESRRYGQPGAVEAAFAALETEVASLSKTKQVYLLLSAPKSGKFSPKTMLDGSRWTVLARRHTNSGVDISSFLAHNAPIRARLIAIAGRHGAIVIDPVATLCRGSVCPTVSGDGAPNYIDHEHMRPFYVRATATFLDQTLSPGVSTKDHP